MQQYWNIFTKSFADYWHYLQKEMLHPSWHNYFYWLIAVSLTVWLLEVLFPWRTKQSIVRKDFWLDGFYLFFNFFIVSLIGYNAVSNVAVTAFENLYKAIGIYSINLANLQALPHWVQLGIMFVIADFIQWNIHRLLHKNPYLWKFHQLHHSVEEMGFAAHFRFHWMETIIYKTLQYVPLAMLGFGLTDFFVIHIISVAIGHLNHSNINWTYGPLRYIFNNPAMHIWHHAKELPTTDKKAVNFGLSLSVWDYIFGTAYIPTSGRDATLGFDTASEYPKTFWQQMIAPFRK